MFSNENHASGVGENSTETRGLTSNIPTYNTVHFYNPTSLFILCFIYKKVHGRESLVFCTWSAGKRWQSDFIRGLQRRERGGVNATLQYFIGHLPHDLQGIQKSMACGQ